MVTNRDRKSFGSRRAEKSPKVARTSGTVDVFIPVQAFRDPLRGELPVGSKYSLMMDPTGSHKIPSYSAIDLVEISHSNCISS